MDRKLKVLQGYADELLHYLWDPIGVAGIPEARDEYDGYVPQVVSMLQRNASVEEIAGYLTGIERNGMGLKPEKHRANDVGAALLRYRKWIDEQLG